MKKKYILPIIYVALLCLTNAGAYHLGTQHSNTPVIDSSPQPSAAPQTNPSGYVDPFPRYLTDDTTDWLTYTNKKYHFSITYPPTWKYLEIPKSQYNNQDEVVLFSHQDIQSANPHLMTDYNFTISKNNLALNWQSKYFQVEDYKGGKPCSMGNLPGTCFAGILKGDNANQYVFVGKIGDYYIQERGHETSGYYGKTIFHYFGNEITIKLNPQDSVGKDNMGTAILTDLSNGKTKIVIRLESMVSKPPAAIYSGSCAKPGAIKYPLTNVSNGLKTNSAPGTSETILNVSLDTLRSQFPLAIGVQSTLSPESLAWCGDLK
ncbi:MAG TPA: hypothetical protein VL401_03060 [Alphaproteobacteria bacterium]|jgi:hypothetical protein|nr:hypothetical protein [Alphaproteobacteria bacterium]